MFVAFLKNFSNDSFDTSESEKNYDNLLDDLVNNENFDSTKF